MEFLVIPTAIQYVGVTPMQFLTAEKIAELVFHDVTRELGLSTPYPCGGRIVRKGDYAFVADESSYNQLTAFIYLIRDKKALPIYTSRIGWLASGCRPWMQEAFAAFNAVCNHVNEVVEKRRGMLTEQIMRFYKTGEIS